MVLFVCVLVCLCVCLCLCVCACVYVRVLPSPRIVMPRWSELAQSKLVQRLCLRGIPTSVRGEGTRPASRPSCVCLCIHLYPPSAVWQAILGNPHNITRELYEIYLGQAEEVLASLALKAKVTDMFSAPPAVKEPPSLSRARSLALIDVDIPRTFAYLSFFLPEGPMYEPLRHILQVTPLPSLPCAPGSFLVPFLRRIPFPLIATSPWSSPLSLCPPPSAAGVRVLPPRCGLRAGHVLPGGHVPAVCP